MTDLEVHAAVDPERLCGWLRDNVAEPAGPLRIEQLSGGASNLTFRVRDDVNDWVLRRPPVRRALETAYDMRREHRVQAALRGDRSSRPARWWPIATTTTCWAHPST